MKLRARAFGLAVGIVWGLAIFVATVWISSMGPGSTLGLLGAFYFGYSVSFGGAFVGFLWGVVNGFLVGATIAWLYNMLHSTLYKSETSGT